MISIKIDDKELNGLLTRLENRLKDRREIMRQIAEDMKSAVEENFEQEGRPTRWVKSKKKEGKTLTLSGKLGKVSRTADNDKAVVVASMVYAAAHHFGIDRTVSVRAHMRRNKGRDVYAGGTRGGRGKKIGSGVSAVGTAFQRRMKLPARPFMTLTEGDLEGIKKRIMGYLLYK